jgi:hypothetical protein
MEHCRISATARFMVAARWGVTLPALEFVGPDSRYAWASGDIRWPNTSVNSNSVTACGFIDPMQDE